MNYYLSYFLEGLRKYCGLFPQVDDLPDSIPELPEIDLSVWETALELNYGAIPKEGNAVPLRSIFEHLKNNKTNQPPYPFHPLSIGEDAILFKKEVGDFQKLVDGFTTELGSLKKQQSENFSDTLVFLSKKFFSNAGFSPDFPHVSLHEHLKTTTALADSIARSDKSKVALLVGIGLDGIQAFCYDIVRNRAARSMKGRSFYLQMILDSLAHNILRHEDVKGNVGNILYARGGKMFLILPDNAATIEALKQIRNDARDKLWNDHGERLFLFFEFTTIENDSGGFAWETLEKQIKESKRRKFHSNLIDEKRFGIFFNPIPEGFDASDTRTGKTQRCSVTGETLKITALNREECLLDEGDADEPPTWVKPIVKIQAEIGRRLNKAKSVAIESVGSAPRKWVAPIGGSTKMGLLRENDLDEEDFAPLSSMIRLLNEPNLFLERGANGFQFYGGNEQPTKNDSENLKEFSELADINNTDDQHRGFHRLGVARIDLDGLGSMVQQVKKSFAVNATLSMHLDVFLSGYVNTIRKNIQDGEGYLNILFSGGDDMLVVGRWDVVLNFVERVRSDFRQFIGGQDFCTLSAGIVLVAPKFPIGKATVDAGAALEAAKAFKGMRKNAITFFGMTVSWEEEFEEVKNQKNELAKWLKEGQISAGFLQKLMQLQYIKDKHLLDSRIRDKPDLSYRWMTAWQFGRLSERISEKTIREKIKKMGEDLFLSERKYDLLALAARWAELERRAAENNKSL